MLNLTDREIRDILSTTKISKSDIEKHIKQGVLIYSSYNDYKHDMNNALIEDIELIQHGFNMLDRAYYNNTLFYIDYVL